MLLKFQRIHPLAVFCAVKAQRFKLVQFCEVLQPKPCYPRCLCQGKARQSTQLSDLLQTFITDQGPGQRERFKFLQSTDMIECFVGMVRSPHIEVIEPWQTLQVCQPGTGHFARPLLKSDTFQKLQSLQVGETLVIKRVQFSQFDERNVKCVSGKLLPRRDCHSIPADQHRDSSADRQHSFGRVAVQIDHAGILSKLDATVRRQFGFERTNTFDGHARATDLNENTLIEFDTFQMQECFVTGIRVVEAQIGQLRETRQMGDSSIRDFRCANI